MLEHAVWLDFVEWCLEKAFLFKLIVVLIIDRGEFLGLQLVSMCKCVQSRASYLFVQEFEICGTLILNILWLIGLGVPVGFLLPLLIFFFLVLIGEVEIVFPLGFFTV